MGDNLDLNDNERLHTDEEEKENVFPPKRRFIRFIEINKFLEEVVRLIIYAIIFVIFYFFFKETDVSKDTYTLINQIDAQNQTLGEVSIVGSEIILDEMLINTSDELENHFVKTIVVISYGSQETGIEISRRLNQIYDRIRKVVSIKKFNELKYVDGQDFLSQEIKTEIQKITGKVDIYNIFFKDFTVY